MDEVTHEPDVAVHAGRVVRFRDGRVVGDEPVQPRGAGRAARRPARADVERAASCRILEGAPCSPPT